MKKFFMGLGLLALMMAVSQCFAGDEIDVLAKKEKKELARERKSLEKERKQQGRLRKKEMRKLEREKRKQQAAERRTARKPKADKSEAASKAKEEKLAKKHARKEGKAQREEARTVKQLEKENNKLAKKEQRRMEKTRRAEEKRLACARERTKEMEKQQKKDETRFKNRGLAENWKTLRKTVVEKEYHEGKYADVHMLPAWPFANWFFKEKAMLNVNASYWYATDAYDSDGASQDLTALDFGYQTIHLKDILLASKLLGEEKVKLPQDEILDNMPLSQFIHYFGNQVITFNGKSEKYGLEFDFARHVLRDDITIGVQIPFLYIKNHLDATMDFPSALKCFKTYEHDSEAVNNQETWSLPYKEELYRVLKAKGIKELGGSAAGFGDVVLFGNVEITTKYIDKIVAGLKVGLPTGKEESMCKLWSPALCSNGNCAEFAAFVSFLVNYNKYINPHLFLQASLFSTGHVNKRIPHYVKSDDDAEAGQEVGNDLMAMGDRIEYKQKSETDDSLLTFEGLDSSIRGFADRPISVKYEKGPEFHLRLGNVFDKFICRRGFLDIYYDLRFKLKDEYRAGSDSCCVNKCEYDIKSMEKDTKSVEHRLGMEYSHQFDPRTRLKASMTYSVAGMNAPKAFDVGLLLGHSF